MLKPVYLFYYLQEVSILVIICTLKPFSPEGTPRLANNAPMNQTYRTCEGAELNMTASFVSVPGPFISWYLLPNTRKYVHHLEGRVGPGTYTKVFYKTNYHIPVMYRHLFGTYLVEANNFRGSIAKTYIRVLKNSSCSGNLLFLFFPNSSSKIFLENDKSNRMSEIVFSVFFIKVKLFKI